MRRGSDRRPLRRPEAVGLQIYCAIDKTPGIADAPIERVALVRAVVIKVVLLLAVEDMPEARRQRRSCERRPTKIDKATLLTTVSESGGERSAGRCPQ